MAKTLWLKRQNTISKDRSRFTERRSKLYSCTRFISDPSVCIISIFPGITRDVLQFFADKYSGLVIKAYGAGNVPNDINDELSFLDKRGRNAIAVVTQCPHGSTSVIYETAVRVPLLADMTSEAAMAYVSILLGNPFNDDRVYATKLKLLKTMKFGDKHEGTSIIPLSL